MQKAVAKRALNWIAGTLVAFLWIGCSKWNEPVRTDHVSGTIEVDESRLASRYGGRVEQILAREGDPLNAGQTLITLSAAELKARHAQTAALLAELKAGARKEELAAAKNDWEAVLAELEFARTEQRRVTELFEQKTVPESERDRAVTRVASLEKSVAAAKSRYELLLAGTRPERIAQAEAQLAEIETQIREMQIVAPTNAILEVLHVKIGDVPGPNQPVATLILTNHLWVRVYVPEPWLGFIKLGQQVRVRVDSFPDRDFAGEVEQIARAAEFTPRNVQTVSDRVKQVFGVKVRLPADNDALRAGMAADVYFPDTPKGN
ncbi:MAG TPA: efflux RND transporter periplasmic adaptor subunit [Candidatus Kapabacteria bacterium]|nr:efflux RND transporter periplasmic adaptor subunit [Candidatus Kapabacteria bacterium]